MSQQVCVKIAIVTFHVKCTLVKFKGNLRTIKGNLRAI